MEQMNDQWFWAAIIGFILGALVFWLFTRSGNNKRNEDFDSLEKEYHRYREEVNAHFAKTADAVDNLTKSYQDVFTHLSDGAERLMDKNALQAQLEKRQGKAVTLAYLVDEKDNASEQSTKIEQRSVVNHQQKSDNFPHSDQSDRTHKLEDNNKTNQAPTTAGKQAVKRANESIQQSATGQSIPLAANQSQSGTASTNLNARNEQETTSTGKQTNKPSNELDQQHEKIQAQSVTTTVNTTNQPTPGKDDAKLGQAKGQQPIRAESTAKTVNTTNQPAPTTAQTRVSQPAKQDDDTTPSDKPTPAREAAAKAGLKPVSSLDNRDNSESAIDSVKKHLRDDNKPS